MPSSKGYQPGHLSTIGILLVDDREDVVARYAQVATTSPLAVATYTYDNLPPAARIQLPSTTGLRHLVRQPPH